MRDRFVLVTGVVAAALLAGCQPSEEKLIADGSATVKQYCVECHNYAEQVGGLSLERVDFADIGTHAETWEKVVRKLRAGVMPPVDQPRPDRDTYVKLASFIEGQIDESAKPVLPAPGAAPTESRRVRQCHPRLARARGRRSDVPAGRRFEPRLRQSGRHARAFARIARDVSHGRRQDQPLGARQRGDAKPNALSRGRGCHAELSRRRLAVRDARRNPHRARVPADGKYTIKVFSVNLGNMGNFRPFGEVRGEKLEVLVDGERIDLVDWDEAFGIGRGFGGGNLKTIDVSVPVTAGPHTVGVTFLATNYAPGLDMNRAFERSTIETGGLPGFTFYPHVGSVRIDGPYEAAGAADTPSRRAVLICEPASAAEERPCAERIVTALARRAYRGTATPDDLETLLAFYDKGRAQDDFETGIEMALQRLLTDPKFIYRVEREPDGLAPDATYRVSDLELASRLSFFLWSSIPDDELLTLAEEGKLKDAKRAGCASAAHARGSALGGTDREFRGSMAQPARAGGPRAGGEPVPGFRRQLAASISPRNGALVR